MEKVKVIRALAFPLRNDPQVKAKEVLIPIASIAYFEKENTGRNYIVKIKSDCLAELKDYQIQVPNNPNGFEILF